MIKRTQYEWNPITYITINGERPKNVFLPNGTGDIS